MHLTLSRPVLTCLLLLALGQASVASPRPTPSPHPVVRADIYSPRLRRTAQNYLRLRMLELREADLDRARAVIEHRLDIKALLEDPSPAPVDARKRNMP
jgi:hypothetical protein